MGSIKDRNGMDLTEAEDIKKKWQEYFSGLPLPSPCSRRWRRSIQLAKTRLGADCVSDHELHIAKFRLKMNKVWKTTMT